MSTILKSLKKLEKEKEASRYTVQASGYSGPGAIGASSGERKRTWIRRGLVIALIIGLVATSFYFYRQTQREPLVASHQNKSSRPQPEAINREKAQSPSQKSSQDSPIDRQPSVVVERTPPREPAPVKKTTRPRQNERPVAVTPPRPEKRVTVPQKTLPPVPAPQKSPPRTDETAALETPRTPTRSVTRPPTPPPPTRQQEAAPVKVQQTPVKPTPKKAPPKKTNRYPDLRQITDGRLKVHAIVWSDDKADRMAVINTQILHEGDSIAGYSLVAIRQDDVVVRDEAGRLWGVRFGRP